MHEQILKKICKEYQDLGFDQGSQETKKKILDIMFSKKDLLKVPEFLQLIREINLTHYGKD